MVVLSSRSMHANALQYNDAILSLYNYYIHIQILAQYQTAVVKISTWVSQFQECMHFFNVKRKHAFIQDLGVKLTILGVNQFKTDPTREIGELPTKKNGWACNHSCDKWVCIVIQVSTHINILKAKTAVQIRGVKQLKAEWPEGTLSCVISKNHTHQT